LTTLRILLRAGCVAACLVGAGARAEDDRAADPPDAGAPERQQPHAIDLGANFDANLFEQQGNGWVLRGGPGGPRPAPSAAAGGEPDSPTLDRVRPLGAKRLARIDEACRLDAAQRQALRLAIESDLRRFAEEVDAVRAAYAGRQVNMNDQDGQREWHRFQQDVQRCRQRLRTLFDADSLFARVLPDALDAAQLARITSETEARLAFRWRAMVLSALVKMDDTLGLDQAQYEAVERLLLARAPALRSEEWPVGHQDAHLQLNLVYLVLAESDTRELRQAFSERQWRALAMLMNQGRAMKSWIEQQGLVEPRRP